MIENGIYYSICFFFSLLGLGATWSHRYEHTAIKLIVAFLVPIALSVLYFSGAALLTYLDARVIWPWVTEAHNPEIRFRAMAATVLFIGIAAYVVVIEHLLFTTHKRITSKGIGRRKSAPML